MAKKEANHRTRREGPGDRLISHFLADRRLRFLVHAIALAVAVVLLMMFELPALFGIAFVGWWVVWSIQRDSAEIYRELYEINEQLSGRKDEFREVVHGSPEARSTRP